MKYKINDVVRLLEDMPSEGLVKGAMGVIVLEFMDPEEAYEVEFVDESGETITELALLPDQITILTRLDG